MSIHWWWKIGIMWIRFDKLVMDISNRQYGWPIRRWYDSRWTIKGQNMWAYANWIKASRSLSMAKVKRSTIIHGLSILTNLCNDQNDLSTIFESVPCWLTWGTFFGSAIAGWPLATSWCPYTWPSQPSKHGHPWKYPVHSSHGKNHTSGSWRSILFSKWLVTMVISHW